jgi:hypothetical protein
MGPLEGLRFPAARSAWWNHKRVHRAYCALHPIFRGGRAVGCRAVFSNRSSRRRPLNTSWALDFMVDTLYHGRVPFSTLGRAPLSTFVGRGNWGVLSLPIAQAFARRPVSGEQPGPASAP